MSQISRIFVFAFASLTINGMVFCGHPSPAMQAMIEDDYGANVNIDRNDKAIIKKLRDRMDKYENEVIHLKQSMEDLVKSLNDLKAANPCKYEESTDLRPKDGNGRNTVQPSDNFQKLGATTLSREDRLSPAPPLKVAFTAYLDHKVESLGPGQLIKYNKMIYSYNETTYYNTITGIFTVPISGIYLFSWTVTARKLPGRHGYDVWNTLHINGHSVASSVADSHFDTDDQQGSATVVVHANQGDVVWTSSCCQGHDIYGNTSKTTLFSGVMLFAD